MLCIVLYSAHIYLSIQDNLINVWSSYFLVRKSFVRNVKSCVVLCETLAEKLLLYSHISVWDGHDSLRARSCSPGARSSVSVNWHSTIEVYASMEIYTSWGSGLFALTDVSATGLCPWLWGDKGKDSCSTDWQTVQTKVIRCPPAHLAAGGNAPWDWLPLPESSKTELVELVEEQQSVLKGLRSPTGFLNTREAIFLFSYLF